MAKRMRGTFHLQSFFVFLVVFLLCIDFSKSSVLTLSQIPLIKYLFINLGNNRLIILTIGIYLILVFLDKYHVDNDILVKTWMLFAFGILAILISLSRNISSGSAFYDISVLLLLCVMLSFRLKSHQKLAENTILFLGYVEGVLGLYQHFARITIFSPYFGEKLYLNTVFYLNGFSSNNPVYLNYGAQVRSFGTMDSGLSFGLFMLLCLAIVLSRTTYSKGWRFTNLVFFGLAIFGTITRNVYIGAILFLVLVLGGRRLTLKGGRFKTIYIIGSMVGILTPWFERLITLLGKVSTALNIPTFLDRFSFIDSALTQIRGIGDFLWGRQVVAGIQNPIDNAFVASMLNNGAVFAISLLLILYQAFSVLLKDASEAQFAKLWYLALLPLLGTFNNITVAMSFGTALVIMTIPAESKIKEISEMNE